MSSSNGAAVPRVFSDCREAFEAVWAARAAGRKVGVVPTMGALHEGHLSLVRAANAECDFSIATIFVNPTQFAPHEDFSKYPRTFDDDLQRLRECDADWVFAPSRDAMYPPGYSTRVEPPLVAQPLEGVCRPGHFSGVATVVLKLFQLLPADFAYFGQKDYQQSLVIRHMVRDLNVPVEIRVCPIVREADGLAMSSRNRYLSPTERQQAAAISRSLRLAEDLCRRGERDVEHVSLAMRTVLLDAGITQIEYVALADPDTLAPVERATTGVVALIAARVGVTRLIDNLILP